jgi:SWI/SNF-related matrix-associated actin-dependent regulator 1 of chromatin subfamily A
MPFQLAGIAYAAEHPKCLIADEMGLGKTIQAIGLINLLHLRKVLVVCPASLKINWQREMQKWLVDRQSIEIENGSWRNADVCIVNYDILKKHSETIRNTQWDILIGDESHYVKNHKAQRTQLFFSIPATRKLLLTGTPVLNRPIELFPMLQDFGVYFAKNFWKYGERYCDMQRNKYGTDVSGASNTEELGMKLRETCMVRRQKSQVLSEMPDKMRQIIPLPTNGADKAVQAEAKAYTSYETQTKDARNTLARLRKAGVKADSDEHRAAVSEMKAQMVSFGDIARLRHETAIRKIDVASDAIMEAVDSSKHVIVFAHHKDVLDGINSKLNTAGITTTVLTGETPINARQQIVDDFQAGTTQVFLGSTAACGVGLTLTKSSHVIFVEMEWTPAIMEQAEDRAHRIGQKNAVLVQYLVYDGSIDGMLARKLVDKEEIIEGIMEDMN